MGRTSARTQMKYDSKRFYRTSHPRQKTARALTSKSTGTEKKSTVPLLSLNNFPQGALLGGAAIPFLVAIAEPSCYACSLLVLASSKICRATRGEQPTNAFSTRPPNADCWTRTTMKQQIQHHAGTFRHTVPWILPRATRSRFCMWFPFAGLLGLRFQVTPR